MSEYTAVEHDPFDPRQMHYLGSTAPPDAPATGPVLVAKGDRTQIVKAEQLPEHEVAGWRYAGVPSAEQVAAADTSLSVATPPAEAPGDLWPASELARYAVSQRGNWAFKAAKSRQALDDAADQLAAYIGRGSLHELRANSTGGPLAPSAVRAADLAGAAYTAEAAVLLLERVTALEHEVAALRLELERSR